MCVVVLCSQLVGAAFSDVYETDWYYNDVNAAVKRGLINGKSETQYAPNDNLTYAEAVKLASCMNKLAKEGNSEFGSDEIWYAPYVAYAKNNGIISKDYNWNESITRADYMEIFSKALPEEQLGAMNSVPYGAIPDISVSDPYAKAVYKLYRAGIVQGSDELYSCKPNDNIKRSEVAAILTRMMDINARKHFDISYVPGGKYSTGYELYNAKLAEYEAAANLTTEELSNKHDSLEGTINYTMVFNTSMYGGTLAYTLYDIDKNGVNELILSNTQTVIDVYTQTDGSLIKLFEDCYFGDKVRLHILTDGSLLAEGASSAFSSQYEAYKLGADGYSLTETENGYFNDMGEDEYMSDHTYLSMNEYESKVQNYLSKSIMDEFVWNLFVIK